MGEAPSNWIVRVCFRVVMLYSPDIRQNRLGPVVEKFEDVILKLDQWLTCFC